MYICCRLGDQISIYPVARFSTDSCYCSTAWDEISSISRTSGLVCILINFECVNSAIEGWRLEFETNHKRLRPNLATFRSRFANLKIVERF